MKVGFTGTRKGMTNQQLIGVHMLLGELKEQGANEAHHGMCIEADEQFHFLANSMRYRMVGHPGLNRKGEVSQRGKQVCDALAEAKFFLDRNKDIVDEVDVMIATPGEVEEQMMGSGTWATIRYARKTGKMLYVFFPDGVGCLSYGR